MAGPSTGATRWDDAVWLWITEHVDVGQTFTNQQLRRDDDWFNEVRGVHSDDPNSWVRRSLQTLRNVGLVEFVEGQRGTYRRLGDDDDHGAWIRSR